MTPGDDGAGSGIVTGSSNAKSTLSYRKKQSAPLALSHYNSGHGSRSRSRKPKRRHRKLPDTWHLNQQVTLQLIFFFTFTYVVFDRISIQVKLGSSWLGCRLDLLECSFEFPTHLLRSNWVLVLCRVLIISVA